MSQQPIATILSIGTELTDGELANANAAWLSERLVDFQIKVAAHLTVPDERTLILDALTFACQRSHIIFVTGGLGPTSDDFTRNVVAEFCGKELIWNEESWQHVQSRLQGLKVPVSPTNRQQCFFPETSEILHNSEGTAHGFLMSNLKLSLDRALTDTIVVLPGPPVEIDAIWRKSLKVKVSCYAKQFEIEPTVLRKWILIGVSESVIAEQVESILQSIPVTVGYRARVPFIDVKIWMPNSLVPDFDKHIASKLNSIFGPYLCGTGHFSGGEYFLSKIGGQQKKIIDCATDGGIARSILSAKPHSVSAVSILSLSARDPNKDSLPTDFDALIQMQSDGKWSLSYKTETGVLKTECFQTRYTQDKMRNRLKLFIVETAMIFLANIWSQNQ
jgi:molybdenum cofactor synthesis domain-containing protein